MRILLSGACGFMGREVIKLAKDNYCGAVHRYSVCQLKYSVNGTCFALGICIDNDIKNPVKDNT